MRDGERPPRELHVAHEGEARFRISVRGHAVLVDQPAPYGRDSAPTPTELFVASVAACAAYYGRTFLARRGLPDRVDVAAHWELGKSPERVARIHLSVQAPGVPEDKWEVFRRVVEGCLVHNTLTKAPDVLVELRTTEATSVAG